MGPLIPLFGLRVMFPLGFKARVGSLICTWWRCTCYTSGATPADLLVFSMAAQGGQPYLHLVEVYVLHLWCNTCWPFDVQHGSSGWAALFALGGDVHVTSLVLTPADLLVFSMAAQGGQPYLHLVEVYVLHLWCNTCWPFDVQHGISGWAALFALYGDLHVTPLVLTPADIWVVSMAAKSGQPYLVSTYIVCERLSVMHQPARLPENFHRTPLFWNFSQNTPRPKLNFFPEFKSGLTQNTPPKMKKNRSELTQNTLLQETDLSLPRTPPSNPKMKN